MAALRALEHYRFVGSVIDPGPQLTAARLACLTLAECSESLPEDLASALAGCAASKRADGEFAQLAAIEALHAAFEKQEPLAPEAQNARDLIDLVWMNLFQRYFWLKNRNREDQS